MACLLAAAGLLAAPVAHAVPSAQPTVGCSWAPARSAVETVTVAEVDDNGEDGGVEREEEPRIVGSLPAPPNVRANDQRALSAVARVSQEQAVQIALGALPDADRRRVEEAELEVEQGYVVWEVETELRGREPSQDRHAAVVIDAGNGNILLVECEAEDD